MQVRNKAGMTIVRDIPRTFVSGKRELRHANHVSSIYKVNEAHITLGACFPFSLPKTCGSTDKGTVSDTDTDTDTNVSS